jgi:predicted RNA binding protein YcfA (HicA-like mRNA interferase family)
LTGGKGSHRNYEHPEGARLTISEKLGADAQKYQEKLVRKALKQIKKR